MHHHRITPGQCRYCGCTDERACPGGCWWMDEAHTICSRCSAAPDQAAAVALGLSRARRLLKLIHGGT
jgi:hypothetical protein